MPDDDLYELAEPDDEQSSPSESPPRRPVTSRPPPAGRGKPAVSDPGLVLRPPRYCPSCGEDLTFEDDGLCPRCGRGFDPGDPATYRSEPLEEGEENFWLAVPRLAGYGLLVLFVVGRVMIGALGEGFADGGQAATVFGAAMLGVTVPWVAGCLYLLLVVLRDYINPVFVVLLPVCVVLSLLLTFGAPPLAVGAGVLVSPGVALVRAWRAA